MLYRTNAQSRVFEEALLAEGIPYRVVGGVGFYARTEIKDVIAYLRYIANSSDALAFKRIVNVPRRGIGQQTLAALVQAANAARVSVGEAVFDRELLRTAVPKKLKELERFAELVADLRAQAQNVGVADLLVAVMEQSGYVRELQAEFANLVLIDIPNAIGKGGAVRVVAVTALFVCACGNHGKATPDSGADGSGAAEGPTTSATAKAQSPPMACERTSLHTTTTTWCGASD